MSIALLLYEIDTKASETQSNTPNKYKIEDAEKLQGAAENALNFPKDSVVREIIQYSAVMAFQEIGIIESVSYYEEDELFTLWS